jgi:HlyD family secretion protein
MKRHPILLVTLSALVIIGAFLFSGGEETSTEYRTAVLKRGTLVRTVTASGSVTAMVTVEVGSELSGRLAAIEADFNDRIEQGQVLARLDPETFEARVREAQAELEVAQTNVMINAGALEQRKAELADVRGTLRVLQSEAASAKAQAEQAKHDLERKSALQSGRAVSESDLQQAEAAMESRVALAQAATERARVQKARIAAAQAGLRMAEGTLENAKSIVKQRQAALEKAQIDLSRSVIRSPIDGVVISRDVDMGQTVAASLKTPTLFTIAKDLAQIQLELRVSEADIGELQVGQSVEFTVDAYPKRGFSGRVTQVRKAPKVFQNVVTYSVIVEATNPGQALFPGMTALATIQVSETPDVLRLPNAALRFDPPGRRAPLIAEAEGDEGPGSPARVWTLQDGRLDPTSIRIGGSDGAVTGILAGPLKEGDEVVVGVRRPMPD